ncbi:hypothetical protein RHMOL_Rhmol06G0219700 [Rhododendron molle]|uniref:Uncharacterized protein n=1 Tax=Rhododendron molle TaxID=49168 RepID=A0ACC0NG77_RHOML|nr:hypothetical protein RHMOL_Rhmol06G0219700 [Rhododendron molle]
MVVSVNWVGEGVVVYVGDSRIGSLLRGFTVGCLRKLGERMAFMKGRVKEWVVEKLDCSRGLRAWQFRKWWEIQRTYLQLQSFNCIVGGKTFSTRELSATCMLPQKVIQCRTQPENRTPRQEEQILVLQLLLKEFSNDYRSHRFHGPDLFFITFLLDFPFTTSMGRNKLPVRKIDNQTSRQVMYSKRKDAIVKKASELSVLCDTDVGLLMFSPTGRFTSFASDGRVEDIFLRFISRPDELKGGSDFLKSGTAKPHEKFYLVVETIPLSDSVRSRYYNPNVENIDSLFEAGVYQQFLENAIERVEQSKIAAFNVQEEDPNTDESANSNIIRFDCSMFYRNLSRDEQYPEEAYSPGPHLSLQFLKAQKNWNLA